MNIEKAIQYLEMIENEVYNEDSDGYDLYLALEMAIKSLKSEKIDMTFEELKTEAQKQGYTLCKFQPHIKLKPCTCGCNRREHWYGIDPPFILRCKKCGREAYGSTEKEAREVWNMMIESED